MWLLEVASGEVRARAARVARRLGGRIVAAPLARLHVTLLVCGFPDELPPGLPGEHRKALVGATAPVARVHGPSLSYVSVHLDVCDCGGGIAALRSSLLRASRAAGHVEPRETPYHPHVTVGDVTGSFTASSLRAVLGDVDREPVEVELGRLSLVALDTRSHHAPYVEVLEEIPLS